jgi:methylated-DNA-protein-cysteine methyltransferase related protein
MPSDTAQAQIAAVLKAIPRGRVCAYGWVAELAGLRGRARLVAWLLAHGGERDLPWHRVLRSDGRIAFAPGSDGYREQARRLRAEGVTVSKGRVDLARFGWRGDLDALLWGSRE